MHAQFSRQSKKAFCNLHHTTSDPANRGIVIVEEDVLYLRQQLGWNTFYFVLIEQLDTSISASVGIHCLSQEYFTELPIWNYLGLCTTLQIQPVLLQVLDRHRNVVTAAWDLESQELTGLKPRCHSFQILILSKF